MESSNVMIGGEGEYSYAKNSVYQGSTLDVVKSIVEDEINAKLDIISAPLSCTGPNCFRIADFGCSTGHNTIKSMELIVDTVRKKFTSMEGLSDKIPEFEVFFSDLPGNDFNTLFNSLPLERNYYVAGVPGTFYGRLFPKSSLHFAHSSWSLLWLSQAPTGLVDTTSPAWNKGRIHYYGAPKEVFDAYLDQYSKDIALFLNVRAQELVGGGLMTLLIPAVPSFWDPKTSYVIPSGISILGSCLKEIADEGKLREEVIDYFNVPLFMPTPEELKAILERSCDFTIERMEILENPRSRASWYSPKAIALFTRAAFEGAMKKYFEPEIIDEAFSRYENKLASEPYFGSDNDKSVVAFVLLRRINK